MTGILAALVLLCSLPLVPVQTAEVSQKISLMVAEAGGTVTFKCPISDKKGKFFHWYKQPLGYMVQTVASGSYTKLSLSAQFQNQHFNITAETDQYLLSIRNISKEDEGSYFCQDGTAYDQNFVTGVFLAVKDCNQEKSLIVEQTPDMASVRAGQSMVFKCSLLFTNNKTRVQCPGEHSVHWYRAGSGESHPGVIYAHNNRSFYQGERSCVYGLSKTIQNSSDAGTYYCAVVTCGEILFGGGTKVKTRPAFYPLVITLGVLLAYCVISNTVLLFHARRSRVCEQCKGGSKTFSHDLGHEDLTVEPPSDQDEGTEAENYATLNFPTRKVRSVKKNRESPQECVYSAVRGNHQTPQHP